MLQFGLLAPSCFWLVKTVKTARKRKGVMRARDESEDAVRKETERNAPVNIGWSSIILNCSNELDHY